MPYLLTAIFHMVPYLDVRQPLSCLYLAIILASAPYIVMFGVGLFCARPPVCLDEAVPVIRMAVCLYNRLP